MTWLDDVMESTEELESPRSFFYWSGLATISAVLKDSVWLDRAGAHKLYPNIYVMLLADSALKKGAPIALSKDIVALVNNTKLIVGRSSIQGILKRLGTAKTEPGGKVNAQSTGYVVASEFSSSLVEDPSAFNLLTDLYDRHWNRGEWEQLLKGEQFSLKDPTLSMLVATNDAHLKDFVKEKDIYGGFFGRMFVIREEKINRLNSLVYKLKNPPDAKKFAPYLKQLSLLKGEFKPLDECAEAGEFYDQWYNEFYGMIAKHKVQDNTGTIGRFGDSVLKIAMLLSLSEKPELEITMTAMHEAIKVAEKFVEGVKRAIIQSKGKAQYTEQKSMIIEELLNRNPHVISRAQLLKKYWMHINADELDIVMRSFDESGHIKVHNRGGVIMYEMSETIANELKEFLQRND